MCDKVLRGLVEVCCHFTNPIIDVPDVVVGQVAMIQPRGDILEEDVIDLS
jgi:hypothetical protein